MLEHELRGSFCIALDDRIDDSLVICVKHGMEPGVCDRVLVCIQLPAVYRRYGVDLLEASHLGSGHSSRCEFRTDAFKFGQQIKHREEFRYR